MPHVRLIVVLLIALTSASNALAQNLQQRAKEAYQSAKRQELSLKESPASKRLRSDYLSVIRLYERVYLTTPHTGFADDALMAIAGLYQDIKDSRDAIKTLQFLIREYPQSPFIKEARNNIVHLKKPTAPAVSQLKTSRKTKANPSSNPNATEKPSPDSTNAMISVDKVRYWESRRSVRVVIDMDGKASFTQGEVKEPARVFVDISTARLGEALEKQTFPVKSVMLEKIRVAQHDFKTVRVVLDLVQLTNVTTFALREPDRLVIDVLGDPSLSAKVSKKLSQNSSETVTSETTEERSKTEIVKNSNQDPENSSLENIGMPAQPTANGDHSLIRSLGLKVGRVVLDAGHGGHDTGTIGQEGLTEKEVVLDIALRLKKRIEKELGAEVVMTRKDDKFVPLETRTAIANQAEADLFLSVHANASRVSSTRGYETYFLNFTTSREGLEIAARENAASQRSISELQDIVRRIMLRDKLDESREFAAHIQDSMAKRKHFGNNRGIKQAPFVVLIGATMPSILAEVSFISNPDDEQLLKGENRRQQIADALFEGIRSYSDTLSGFRAAKIQD